MENSKKYSLNKADLIKIATGAFMAVLGALATYLVTLSGQIDLGEYTPLAVAVFSIIANLIRKFIKDNK